MRPYLLPLCAALTFSVCSLAQDQPQPMTHVALYKIKPNKVADWSAVMKGVYTPVLEQLLKEGAVVGYGVDLDILHQAGKTNASAWFTVPDWAAYAKVSAAIDEAAKKSPGQMVRLQEATDPEAHQDLLVRATMMSVAKPPAGALPVGSYTMIKVKPGKNQAWMKLVNAYEKPVLDQLLKDGVIWGYGIDVEVEHTMPVGTRVQWMTLPNLAARDKVAAAFRAARSKLSEDGRRTLQASYEEVLETEHTDWMSQTIVFGSR